MEPLDFEVKKTVKQFHSNYRLHDQATKAIVPIIYNMGFKLKPFGEDARYLKVWAKGQDKPDAILTKNGKDLAFIEWKGHSHRTWMLNSRAYRSYLEHGRKHQLPVILIWYITSEDKAYYVTLPFKKARIKYMKHNGNWVTELKSTKQLTPLSQLKDEFQPTLTKF